MKASVRAAIEAAQLNRQYRDGRLLRPRSKRPSTNAPGPTPATRSGTEQARDALLEAARKAKEEKETNPQ